MRGIECAFQGTLGKAAELKTSKTGTPYAGLSIVVTVGKGDDGKDIGQWIRVTCFKEVASAIAATAKKGDRVYCEGSLTMTQWNDAHGEAKTGLNVAAWKVVLLGQIGEKRKHARKPLDPSETPRQTSNGGRELNDPLPF